MTNTSRIGSAAVWGLAAAAMTTSLSIGLAGEENANRAPTGEVEFQKQKWVSYADKAEVTKYKDKDALHVTTKTGGMVMLDGVSFEDGTIECDIAKGPFTGIFFRAADAQHADCVYFRPQNAVPGEKALDGTPGRDRVVQYVAWGDPKTEWAYLRKTFPGKYEAYAGVPGDGWFHVRLEIKGRQVTVFVNDAKEPCLTVEETLQENRKGKIGLWAWDGYFSNFAFKPSEDGK